MVLGLVKAKDSGSGQCHLSATILEGMGQRRDESIVAALGRWDNAHSTTFLFLDSCKACAGQVVGLA